MPRTPMTRHLTTATTGEASATTTTDAVATMTTSACKVPVTATMKWENEEAIIHGKETEVRRV
jgi:hypothetical protein